MITATNRVLEDEVEAGHFREDLYHWVNLVNLKIPPLRKRREDIPLLVSHFLGQANRELGTRFQKIELDALQRLQRYNWPGNVRELGHIIKRPALLAHDPALTIHDLQLPDIREKHKAITPDTGTKPNNLEQNLRAALDAAIVEPDSNPFHSIVGFVERTLIDQALHHTGGNQVSAANLLGINRTTLRKKINQANME